MVARLLWEQDVAGSNPVIPTKKGRLSHCFKRLFLFWSDSRLRCMLRIPNPDLSIRVSLFVGDKPLRQLALCGLRFAKFLIFFHPNY